MINCKICERELKNVISLVNHLKSHKTNSKEYYNNYYLKPGEGICECGKTTKYLNFTEGYQPYCSQKCMHKSEKYKASIKATNLERYGVENVSQVESVKETRKNTMQERYGVNNAFESDIFKEKAKQSLITNHGVDHVSKIDGIRERTKETNLKNHGVEYTFQRKDVKEKIKNSMMKNHGVDNIFKADSFKDKMKIRNKKIHGVEFYVQSDEFKNKFIETSLINHGEIHPMKTKEVVDKLKNTMIVNHGQDNPMKVESIKEQAYETNLERYGKKHPGQVEEFKEQAKKTNLERHGKEYYTQTDEYKERAKKTNLKNHGVEYYTQTDEYKERAKETNLKNHGVEYFSQSEDFKEKCKVTQRTNYWDRFVILINAKKLTPLFDKEYYVNNEEFKFKCDRCDNEFITDKTNPQHIYCNCFISKGEVEIREYIESLGIEYETNKRWKFSDGKSLEIDVFLPEYNIGLEYDGLYWHNELHKDSDYHVTKTDKFKDEFDIDILHIFENDWLNKPDIIKSIINNKIGNNTRIYARKTELIMLDNKTYKDFMDDNHIQGSVNAAHKIGLIYNGELVSAISIGKSRFKKNEMELLRYCNKLNTSIIGGFSKLLKFYLNNSDSDILNTYCDRKYFNASGYKAVGFEEVNITKPGYYYQKGNILYNRLNFQKHKLKSKLESYDPNKSEHENMLINGYFRIYDCGNIKLKLLK